MPQICARIYPHHLASFDQRVAIHCDTGTVVDEVGAGIDIAEACQPAEDKPGLAGTGKPTGSHASTKRRSEIGAYPVNLKPEHGAVFLRRAAVDG